ncbi:MAG: helix-turn-helix transcriptional regulator [Phycisphaerales bacterium]|nr:MAG: helix-turn-helix transcriptional regulator [Phycisphaerales bacterium]
MGVLMTAPTLDTNGTTLWVALMEDSGDQVLVVDHAGRIQAGNVLAAQSLGLEPDKLAGAIYAQNLPAHVQAERLGYIREAFNTSGPIVVDGMLRGIMHRTTYRVVRELAGTPEAVLIVERPAIWPSPTPPGTSIHRAGNDDAGEIGKLTRREREVLRLIGQGLATADIAKILHRSVKTIEWHRVSLGNKLGVTNRVELARIAIRAGLTTLADQPRSELEAIEHPGDREAELKSKPPRPADR